MQLSFSCATESGSDSEIHVKVAHVSDRDRARLYVTQVLDTDGV